MHRSRPGHSGTEQRQLSWYATARMSADDRAALDAMRGDTPKSRFLRDLLGLHRDRMRHGICTVAGHSPSGDRCCRCGDEISEEAA